MENNNYSNSNMENNANESGATPANQQESSSTYSYSYLNEEQKNPNNIWRAEENTTGPYAGSNTYSGTQQDSGNVYGSTQQDSGNVYGNAQQDSGNVYGSTQQDSGNVYGNAQQDSGNAYGSTQSGENDYSNIYGSPNGQSGWNTYHNAKQQKKEERARKRAAKKANANPGQDSNFGIKLAKCASIALVFGLVAGTAFEGSSYVVGNLLGTNGNRAVASADEKDGREVLKIGDGTQSTSLLSAAPSNTEDGVSAIVEECEPSIVAITNMSLVQYQNWFGQIQRREVPSAGSGIIISEDEDYLYIVTNNHVVESATTLTICFSDDTTAAADIKGTDASTDLAVVQVRKSDIGAETLSAIKVATLGDSEKVKVGSRAIAIGNALGYGQAVTGGYISALEREVTTQDEATGKSYTNNLLQTDAAINPGNSGGALLNIKGEVIGINSSKYSDTKVEGMGFAIPINTAKPIIEDLITKKEVSDEKAAYLGIYPQDIPSSVAEAYNMPEGVFIKEVYEGTAAEKYGLQKGDIITQIDGREIKSVEALQSRLSYYEAGTEVEVVVQRAVQDGYEETHISVVLGKRE